MFGRSGRSIKGNSKRHVQLGLEPLEERAMMSAVPAYSSLPGAPHTLYLDFDGHFQPVWNRTDRGQMYMNVSTTAYDTNNAAEFSAGELNDIRAIWRNVADDFAPFNINVTTVEPPAAAFATNRALRVVMADSASAMLAQPQVVGRTTLPFTSVGGRSFITDDLGASTTNNSGYAAYDSYSNSQPNVVYVFTSMIAAPRVIATTASHEAGHAFGLHHQSSVDAAGNHVEYDSGDALTTPIMGFNLAVDRTLWGKNSSQDSVQKLTNVLGARPDDVPGFKDLSLRRTSNPLDPSRVAQVEGAIETRNDSDWYRFSTPGGNFEFNVLPVAGGNLDATLTLYQIVSQPGVGSVSTPIAFANPTIWPDDPFSGLDAAISLQLAAGDYYIAVGSHGNYGDMGLYTLNVTGFELPPTHPYQFHPTPYLGQPAHLEAHMAAPVATPAPAPGNLLNNELPFGDPVPVNFSNHGLAFADPAPVNLSSNDLAFADPATVTHPEFEQAVYEQLVDRVFLDWS